MKSIIILPVGNTIIEWALKDGPAFGIFFDKNYEVLVKTRRNPARFFPFPFNEWQRKEKQIVNVRNAVVKYWGSTPLFTLEDYSKELGSLSKIIPTLNTRNKPIEVSLFAEDTILSVLACELTKECIHKYIPDVSVVFNRNEHVINNAKELYSIANANGEILIDVTGASPEQTVHLTRFAQEKKLGIYCNGEKC